MTTAAHCCWGKFEPFFFFFCESEKERQQEGSVARIQYITSSSSTSHRCSIWLRFGQFGGQVGTSASLLCSSNHEPFLLCETTHYPADGGKNPPSGLLPMDTTSWCHLKKKKENGTQKSRPAFSVALRTGPDAHSCIVLEPSVVNMDHHGTWVWLVFFYWQQQWWRYFKTHWAQLTGKGILKMT